MIRKASCWAFMRNAFCANERPLSFAAVVVCAALWCLHFAAEAQTVDIFSNERLESLIREGVPVVDLRTPEEWKATGVISGSELLTFFDSHGNYDLGSWLTSFVAIAEPQDEVALICAVGNRSFVVSRFLVQQFGYQKLYNVNNGIEHWIRSGKPVKKWP